MRWDPSTAFSQGYIEFLEGLDSDVNTYYYYETQPWVDINVENWEYTLSMGATADSPATKTVSFEIYGLQDAYPSGGFEAAVKHIVQDTDTNITMSYSNDTLICSYTPVNNANTSSY